MLQNRSDYSPIPSEPQEPASNGLPALSSQKRTMVMAGWVAVAMVLLIFVVTNTANNAAADVTVMQSTLLEPTMEPTSFWEKYIPLEDAKQVHGHKQLLPEPSTAPTPGLLGSDHRRKDPFPSPVYPPSAPTQPWYSSVYGNKYQGTHSPTRAPVAMPSDPAGKDKLDPAPLVQAEAESEPWWAKFVPPSMRPKIPVLNPTHPPTTDADAQQSLQPTAERDSDDEDEDKDKKKHHHHKKHHKHDDDDDSAEDASSEEKDKEPSSEGDNDETGPAGNEVPPDEPLESNAFVVITSETKNGDPWWMQFVPSQFRSKIRKELTTQPTASPVAAPVIPPPVEPQPQPQPQPQPPALPVEPVPLTLAPTLATTPAPGKEDKHDKKDGKDKDEKKDKDDKKSDKKDKKEKEKEKKHRKHEDDDDSASVDDDSASSEEDPHRKDKDKGKKEDKKDDKKDEKKDKKEEKETIVVKHKHEGK